MSPSERPLVRVDLRREGGQASRAEAAPFVPAGCDVCPIRKHTICRPYADDRLDVLSKYKTGNRTLRRSASLTLQGEPATSFFNIFSGWAITSVLLDGGQRRGLDIRMPGAFVGLDGLRTLEQFDQRIPLHAASVECSTDLSVCVFPAKGLPALLRDHPLLSVRLNDIVLGQNARLQNSLALTGHIPSRNRLAAFVLDTFDRAKRFSPEMVDGPKLRWPLTQEVLGDALGVTNVQVSNSAKMLREAGALLLGRQRLEILNRPLLEEIANYELNPRLLLP